MHTTIDMPRKFASVRADRPLTDAEIRDVVPAVFASHAHHAVTDSYAYLPTSELVDALREEGFEVYMAAQSRTRTPDRREYTRHIVRMRSASADQQGRGEFNELALDTSHDRTRALSLRADRWRQACGNGLVVGGEFDDIRLRHNGRIMIKDVIHSARAIVQNFALVDASRDAMNAIILTDAERLRFAQAALKIRWNPEVRPAPVPARELLVARNFEETPHTLWATFNIIQRNVVGGGMAGITPKGRPTKTRPIQAIGSNTQLNRALWTHADTILRSKS
ncbi:DUF932 domain-containing protein [Nocardia pseudovaccinii]|uniref:DUF932 domain-containing protein n=1 Tax=Nocardia pseudovaccinii TaxID=189540 RepID=UPI0007A3E148|nr:DUF932 domain-containing protein [Nocardia pseudovaccinii]